MNYLRKQYSLLLVVLCFILILSFQSEAFQPTSLRRFNSKQKEVKEKLVDCIRSVFSGKQRCSWSTSKSNNNMAEKQEEQVQQIDSIYKLQQDKPLIEPVSWDIAQSQNNTNNTVVVNEAVNLGVGITVAIILGLSAFLVIGILVVTCAKDKITELKNSKFTG